MLLAFCASCGGNKTAENTDNADTTAAQDTAASNNQGSDENVDTTSTAKEDPQLTGDTDGDNPDDVLLAPELQEYIQANMKDWALVTPEKWLSEDFQKAIDPEGKIKYEKSIAVKGDFNGDGKEDCAGFFMNKANEVRLMVFHKTDDGYEAIKVSDEGKIEGDASLGLGLSLQPAGKVSSYEGGKTVELKHPAFNYLVYGKSSSLRYYKDGKYVDLTTGD
jgi:hypothetical protein